MIYINGSPGSGKKSISMLLMKKMKTRGIPVQYIEMATALDAPRFRYRSRKCKLEGEMVPPEMAAEAAREAHRRIIHAFPNVSVIIKDGHLRTATQTRLILKDDRNLGSGKQIAINLVADRLRCLRRCTCRYEKEFRYECVAVDQKRIDHHHLRQHGITQAIEDCGVSIYNVDANPEGEHVVFQNLLASCAEIAELIGEPNPTKSL